jgi:ATP-binding cassette subfamily B protein
VGSDADDRYFSPHVSADVPHVVRRLWGHLDARRRRQLGALGALVLLGGLSEAVSLGTLLPFLAVLTAPDRLLEDPRIATLAGLVGARTSEQLVLPLAILFAAAAVAATGLRLLLLWLSNRLAYAISGDFGLEIYRRTLYQPYRVQVARNSSTVLAGIAHNVLCATKMLIAQLNLMTDTVILVAIVSTLLLINATAALVAAVVFGGSYLVAYRAARRRVLANGQVVVREQGNIIKVVQEGLGGIRDVLLDWTQPVFIEAYGQASLRLRRASGAHQVLTGSPRYVLEAVGIVLLVGLANWLSRTSGGLGAALPVLGVLALGAQRLLPVMQQAYASWGSIVFNTPPVTDVLDMLDQPLPADAHLPPPEPLRLERMIRLEGIRFRYAADGPLVLDGVTLSIHKGTRIGIVGGTGAGKSTLLDLLIGLLEPTEGSILVDGIPIAGPRLRAWQRTVAHVPQSIYLSDSTIAENIAFGTPPDAIDIARVRQAAAEAQIADFIERLPRGYATPVGERGIRLSGGQRQRVGIARALYKRGSVLVFDEATSALDNATEQSVMETIEGLDRDLTIIIIAHRVTTVRRCDRLVELIGRRVVEYGSYDEMIERSPSARAVAAAGTHHA